MVIWIITAVAAVLAAVALIAYICFRMAFYSPPRDLTPKEEIEIPEGEIYEAFREKMENWGRETRRLPCQEMEITSFDGTVLRGKFYEFAPGAPIELMFHGYRGSAERDLCGGVQRCFRLRRSALIVDQRASGASGSNVITFGLREHRDCLCWVDFMVKQFGPQVKIILTGISMGATTVLLAAGCDLPEQVIGVLADCGFSSAREIIRVVIRKMGLPVGLSYPFVRLGAWLYGGFDLEQTTALEAVKKAKVPVIFYHGDEDDFVPCEMSRQLYEACASRKQLVVIPGAGHGLSYPVDPETYLQTLGDFFGPEASA